MVGGGEPLAGREATAPSIIIRKREVQRREETPPNGGVVWNPLMSSEQSAVQVICASVWPVVNVGRALELH
jgi:hypothetical protein